MRKRQFQDIVILGAVLATTLGFMWRSCGYWRDAVVDGLGGIATTKVIASTFLTVIFGAVSLAMVLRTRFSLQLRRRRDRRKAGQCQDCGYDLTGNESGACPECGRQV